MQAFGMHEVLSHVPGDKCTQMRLHVKSCRCCAPLDFYKTKDTCGSPVCSPLKSLQQCKKLGFILLPLPIHTPFLCLSQLICSLNLPFRVWIRPQQLHFLRDRKVCQSPKLHWQKSNLCAACFSFRALQLPRVHLLTYGSTNSCSRYFITYTSCILFIFMQKRFWTIYIIHTHSRKTWDGVGQHEAKPNKSAKPGILKGNEHLKTCKAAGSLTFTFEFSHIQLEKLHTESLLASWKMTRPISFIWGEKGGAITRIYFSKLVTNGMLQCGQ